MSTLTASLVEDFHVAAPVDHVWRRIARSRRVVIGGGLLIFIVGMCVGTLGLTTGASKAWNYNAQTEDLSRQPPTAKRISGWFGYDSLGRSVLSRSLLGGSMSLAIGLASAALAVTMGVSVGLVAGYRGGWIDSLLMRSVDVLYGLPYVLLVILMKIALERPLTALVFSISRSTTAPQIANFLVLFLAIGAVSWLTMARVVRGQVLSLRSQPFI